MAVLRYLPKVKRGLQLAFGAHFRMIFPKKCAFLILYQWTKSQCHNIFLSQDIEQNVLSSYLDS